MWPWQWAQFQVELNARQNRLDEKEAMLDRRIAELQSLQQQVIRMREQVHQERRDYERKKVLDLQKKAEKDLSYDYDYDIRQDGHSCVGCGLFGTMTQRRVFNPETKRKRTEWVCDDICADRANTERKDLVDGEDYVKRSLGYGKVS